MSQVRFSREKATWEGCLCKMRLTSLHGSYGFVCIFSTVIGMSLYRVWHLCNLPCVYALLRLISNARYVSKNLLSRDKIWNLPWTCCLLASYSATPGPAVWLKLHASTVCRFLSRISYLSSYVLLRRRRSFTSRKVYVCLESFLCFLHISDRAYFFCARCLSLFLLLFVLTPHDSNVAVYAKVCWLSCVFYMPLFG